MQGKTLRGVLFLILAAAIWGCAFVAQTVGMDYIGPLTFTCVRSFIGTLTLLPIVLISDKKEIAALGLDSVDIKTRRRTDIKSFLILGVVIFVPMVMQQIGLVTTSPAKSGFITAMYIVVVPMLMTIFGKRPGINVLISVILAVAGLYLLCVTGSLSIERGDLITLISVFFWGIQIIATGRYAPDMSCIKLVCGQFCVCGLIALPLMLIFEQPSVSGLLDCAFPLLYTGIVSTGVAYSLQALGQKTVPPTIASLTMSLESVFAALSGYFILGDRLTPRELIGCVIMLAAVMLAQAPPPSQSVQA